MSSEFLASDEFESLREAGLNVFHDNRVKSLFHVSKPQDVPGIEKLSYSFKNGWSTLCWIPTLELRIQDTCCVVQKNEGMGRPAVCDFTREFSSLKKAVLFVYDFYFNDPALMNPPEYLKRITTDPTWESIRGAEIQPGKICKHEQCQSPPLVQSVFCAWHHYEKHRGKEPPYFETPSVLYPDYYVEPDET